MKNKIRMIVFVMLSGFFISASQPTHLFGGSSPGGNLWDFLIDTAPFAGTKFNGPISAYYEPIPGGNCGDFGPQVIMYFTVRLSHKAGYLYFYSKKFTTIIRDNQEFPICYMNTGDQGRAARSFLNDAIKDIYKTENDIAWAWKSIENASYNYEDNISESGVFVADIQIAVNPRVSLGSGSGLRRMKR